MSLSVAFETWLYLSYRIILDLILTYFPNHIPKLMRELIWEIFCYTFLKDDFRVFAKTDNEITRTV